MKNTGRPVKSKVLKQRIVGVLVMKNYPMSITMILDALTADGVDTSRTSVWRAVTDLAASNRIRSETVTRAKNKKIFRVFRPA